MSDTFQDVLNRISSLQEVGTVELRPGAGYVRYGVVAFTDETIKAEIAGLSAGVRREKNGTARVYVFRPLPKGREKAEGPYTLKSTDIE